MRYVMIQAPFFLALFLAFVMSRGPELLSPGDRFARLTDTAGVAVIVAAVGLALLAARHLGDSFHVPPHPRADASMVAHGIYRHLRHPMYTAVVFFAIGLFVAKSTVAVALAATALIAFFLAKARYEERFLIARYPEYGDYRQRARGVLPFWPFS